MAESILKVLMTVMPGRVLLADYVTRSVIGRQLKEYNNMAIDDTMDIMREVAELTGSDMSFDVATVENLLMVTMMGSGGILFRVGFRIHLQSPIT